MTELKLDREVVFCEKPPFPKNMLVELTNICNHKCIFCGYRKMRRKLGSCDKELIFDIMEQAYDNGTREIGFYMIGEPLVCKELEEYVKRAKDLGFEYIYLTTNGALANIDRMKTLLNSGLNSVKFSVNAATRETYKKVHGKDDFETVSQNIKDLSMYIKENNVKIPIFISYVKNEWNKHEIDILHQEFGEYVDKIYVFPCANQGGGMSELIDMGVVKKENLQSSATIPCEMLFNRLHITYEGYLDACCADTNNYLAMVDLREMSLADAWHSEAMISLRREHLSGKLSENSCYNCIYKKDIDIKPVNQDYAY